jgi:protease I
MKLTGKNIICLVEEQFEDLELWVPVMRLREEGAHVTLVGTGRAESFVGKHGVPATPDINADQVNMSDYDGVLVPGGWAPDKLRRSQAVLDLVRTADQQGKVIAAICHGGHVLISAGIVKGRKATGTTAIKDDLINAGAEWVDVSALRDGNLVWARVADDIPNFCRELVQALSE